MRVFANNFDNLLDYPENGPEFQLRQQSGLMIWNNSKEQPDELYSSSDDEIDRYLGFKEEK